EDRTGGQRKVGALEEAHTGTLYIDEVADMPMETQGKILRVLVEQKFLRLGGAQKVSVDVRIISSTSRDLDQDIREGRFREDLYHRLNVARIFPISSSFSSGRSRRPRASRPGGSAKMPSRCCRPMTGRATFANS